MTVDDENSVYVGGLPYDSTEDSIQRAFEIYGTIIAVKALSRYSYSRFASSCILIRDSWASTHVNLTMKREEDVAGLNMQLNQGEIEVASNPFELAFRKNPVISAFLKEQETLKKSGKSEKPLVEAEEQNYDKQVKAPVGTIHSEEEVVSNEKVGYEIAEKEMPEIPEKNRG